MTDNSFLIPFQTKTKRVEETWIDYNGHMNVAYYTMAFDDAIDEFLDKNIGLSSSFIKENGQGSYALQTQYRYLNELLLGSTFMVVIFVADHTSKRMHLMLKMSNTNSSITFATCETILVNVDLKNRKSCNYPEFAQTKIRKLYEAASNLRSSTELGHPIGLQTKTSGKNFK